MQMPATTLFERRMEKALKDNAEAMFAVELGDSHTHAKLKGVRVGLEIAARHYRDEVRDVDSEDGI